MNSILAANIGKIGTEELIDRQKQIQWYLEENGVTYNVYSKVGGTNRTWQLNALPFVVEAEEWAFIEKGVQQRAELANLIFRDLYGKRLLIKEGIIPSELVYCHNGFLRSCDNMPLRKGKSIPIYCADLAWDASGNVKLVSERIQAPSGMGYALENRLTLNRVLPDLFSDMNVRRLSFFYTSFREMLHNSALKNKSNPNVVVLTPGPLNETYFEHAYLSSFLGYPLVRGSDLTVRNNKLWLKSLNGLKQVDVILRRLDDVYCDPLELKEDSVLGVAGLLDVVRSKNVNIINPLGSGILESPALLPFMRSIARYFLNEDLILPHLNTWWCGQETEYKYVFENISKLTIKNVAKNDYNHTYFGDSLSAIEKEELIAKIKKRPYQFIAHEKIDFLTYPTLINNDIDANYSVMRSYCIASDNNYIVMPGGLNRTAARKGEVHVSGQAGGISKDAWVLSKKEKKAEHIFIRPATGGLNIPGLDDLPSRTAENLFWVGRYVARTLGIARFIRTAVKMTNEVRDFNEDTANVKCLKIYLQALTQFSMTYPGFLGEEGKKTLDNPEEELRSLILDKNRPGGLSHTLEMLDYSNQFVRNLWSSDAWRVSDRNNKKWNEFTRKKNAPLSSMLYAIDRMITRLMAFLSLVKESIMVDQGILLFYIGYRMEQTLLIISKVRSTLVFKQNDQVEYELLEALLKSHESLNTYRYSYRAYLNTENVIDLLLFNIKYPRSLAYQLNYLTNDLRGLPNTGKSNTLSEEERPIFKAFSDSRLYTAADLTEINDKDGMRNALEEYLSNQTKLIVSASNILSSKYFSHSYEQKQLSAQKVPVEI